MHLNETLERQLADEELGPLLEATNLTKSGFFPGDNGGAHQIPARSKLTDFTAIHRLPYEMGVHLPHDLRCAQFSALLCFLKMIPFEREEVKLPEAVRIFLEPFNTMTKQVVLLHIIQGPTLFLTTTIISRNCVAAKREARYFGEQLLGKLRHYFDEWFEDETLWLASLMDPRFAFLDIVLPAETWRYAVEKFKISKVVSSPELDFERPPLRDTFTSRKDTPVWNILTETKDADSTELGTKEDEIEVEIKQYMIALKRARPQFETDPLEWWRVHQTQFPRISNSVSHYLVCPATSVDCERLFSLAGAIYGNKRRGSLKGETARLLLMLNAKRNADVGRVSKGWSPSEVKRYALPMEMEDVYSDDELECGFSSAGDETPSSDDEK
ncbi:unnamed protein product [Heligmosomoides polygyrus]|uniref:HAT C-terminal dimerisation domain-containing protein n=1 Tax=Heligmosomoides polygyrus TaxID=6339 RepID=A0A3P8BMW4_HELPZ|nr:unnamed protein product [Heligmosomoides polygyrus]